MVPYDQKMFEVAESRARQTFETKNPGDLMAEGKIDGTCEYCKFKKACADTTYKATPTDGEANAKTAPLPILEEFERLVVAERVAQATAKAAEAEKKLASERLKQWFRDTGVRVASTFDGEIKASISWIKGRKTLDKEAMRADGIPVDDYMKDGDGHDRLNVSEKGKRKADET